MIKKHFIELAEIMQDLKLQLNEANKIGLHPHEIHEQTCRLLATFCKKQNTKFDRDKFLKACGVE